MNTSEVKSNENEKTLDVLRQDSTQGTNHLLNVQCHFNEDTPKSQEKNCNSINKIPISYWGTDFVSFSNSLQNKTSMQTEPLEKILEQIKSGVYSGLVTKIRQTSEKSQRNALKQNLPVIVFANVNGNRCNENVEAIYSIILDYDHAYDIEAVKKAAMTIPFVRAAFQSPYDGVKVVVQFNEPLLPKCYKRIWDFIKCHCDGVIGLESDNTPDLCRACFVSYDPNLLENPDFVPFDTQDFEVEISNFEAGEIQESTNPKEVYFPTDYDVDKVWSVVTYLSSQVMEYRDWMKVCLTLHNELGEAGKPYWDLFLNNPHYPKQTQRELDIKWNSCKSSSLKIGTLFYIAKKYGWSDVNPTPPSPVAPLMVGQSSQVDQPSQPQPSFLMEDTDCMSAFFEMDSVPLIRANLPKFLQEYLEIADQITDAQDGAKLTAILPAMAVNIGNRVFIPNGSSRVFPNIWAVVIGPSRIARKTTVINIAKKTLKAYEDTLEDKQIEEFTRKTLLLNNATANSLVSLLAEQPNRLFISNEIGGFLADMNRSYNEGMRQNITDLFDGESKLYTTLTRKEYVKDPSLSILAASTEGWFSAQLNTKADQSSGFTQRFIYYVVSNINMEDMCTDYRDSYEQTNALNKYAQVYEVFRSIPGSFRMKLSPQALAYKNAKAKETFLKVAKLKNEPSWNIMAVSMKTTSSNSAS